MQQLETVSSRCVVEATQRVWRKIDGDLGGQPPTARAAHSADLVLGRLFVFGGWSGNKALNDLFVLEVAKNLWIHVKTNNTPKERNNHATAVVGRLLVIHGGHSGSEWLQDLHILDTSLIRDSSGEDCGVVRGTRRVTHSSSRELLWSKPDTTGTPPSARACHTLTRVNEKLYMFGGYDGAKCFNDVEILDLETFSWIQPKCNGTPPQARNAHTVTVINSCLYLFGGHSGNKHLTDLHVFDTSTLTWSQPLTSGPPPPGLRGHTANAVSNSKIFIFGKCEKARSNDFYIFDVSLSKWLQSPLQSEGAPSGRQRHSATLVESNKLCIFGGFDGTEWLRDFHVFDVAAFESDAISDSTVAKFIENIRVNLFESADFYDMILVVEGHEIKCHRAILASQCRYFHKMFSSDLKESQQIRIVIPNWSFAPFKAMLEFLYTARISPTDVDVLREVLGLADHFALDGLKSVCETSLSYAINDENVVTLFIDADRFQANDLKRTCSCHIHRNFDSLNRDKHLDELLRHPQLSFELLMGRRRNDSSYGETSSLVNSERSCSTGKESTTACLQSGDSSTSCGGASLSQSWSECGRHKQLSAHCSAAEPSMAIAASGGSSSSSRC